MNVEDIKFKELRTLIKQDREITDITKRHYWLIDKWVEYTEKRNALAVEHDDLRHKLLFDTDWGKLNSERNIEGLIPIDSFKERKDYIEKEMIEICMKLNEVDKILDYLATRC